MRRNKSQHQHLSVGFESFGGRGYSDRGDNKEHPKQVSETHRVDSEENSNILRSRHEQSKEETNKDGDGNNRPFIGQAIEKVFRCLQALKGEVNINGRVRELTNTLARKTQKREYEATYRAGLETRIQEYEEREEGISSRALANIANLREEAARMTKAGDPGQGELLRTAAFNEGIDEREREDRGRDETRRLRREIKMLTEEISTYDEAIQEISCELAVARNLQLALRDKTEFIPPVGTKRTTNNLQNDEDADRKKLRELPGEAGVSTSATPLEVEVGQGMRDMIDKDGPGSRNPTEGGYKDNKDKDVECTNLGGSEGSGSKRSAYSNEGDLVDSGGKARKKVKGSAGKWITEETTQVTMTPVKIKPTQDDPKDNRCRSKKRARELESIGGADTEGAGGSAPKH